MTRFLVGVACSILVAATSAQVPTAIETRNGPPLVDKGKDWAILSIGGWWIKVNQANTTTRRISWSLGKSPETLWWHLGWEHPLPHGGPVRARDLYPGNIPYSGWIDLQPQRVIYVRATTKEANHSASFCVFYQERAVARVDFVGEVFVRLDATLYAPSCEP